jgi:ATP-dependent helicase/nuclease subunit A
MMSSKLPMKPQESIWTDAQWKAIHLSGDDILVAAAAGSGKTAVLVERLIGKICNEQEPIDVDQLLVATFTKAAADEMRQRIRVALEKQLQLRPHSEHLRRQLSLIHKASITTIHSFCLEVIQSHYQVIHMDPGFRIANQTEAELLRQDLLEELLEERYGSSIEGSAFWKLVDWFGGERSDHAIYRLIQRLYDDSRSHPSPEHWLQEAVHSFRSSSGQEPVWDEHPWIMSLKQSIHVELQGSADKLKRAISLTEGPGGPLPYLDQLKDELTLVEYLQEVLEGAWSHLYQAFQASGFGRLKPCRGDDVDKELQEQVKELRKEASDAIKGLREELFQRPLDVYVSELEQMEPLLEELILLVHEFAERYSKAKKSKGLVDFSDLEHFCLQILKHPESTQIEYKPSETAVMYQERFAEVCLDEYQDTNRVQEAIVKLISKASPGNRFMVGDVKQSIYRFRLAEPGLFLEKYQQYGTEAGQGGVRIDLAKNFRSRRAVVDGVNFVFKQIMHASAAEITYDEDAKLIYGANYPELDAEHQDNSVELVLIDKSGLSAEESEASEASDSSDSEAEEADLNVDELLELENAQLEARYIAKQIEQWMNPEQPYLVTDKQSGQLRPLEYRDVVILLRATQVWAPICMEELKQAGIPAYAELNTGYFSAIEVQIILSLLKVIDNPLQDIPLASVLRSPIIGLTAGELAEIRIHAKRGVFYHAVQSYARDKADEDKALAGKLLNFLKQLEQWRDESRQGSLADLIWSIYQWTGYFDYVGGLPGGIQRQANLRALYDRARQYEATTFRGLFRFLRFIERMQDSGGDLGTAGALGEQEDVVRILSIHKSKGLEFPVVFAAGMAKNFNQQDLNQPFLIHRTLGFGPKFVDTELRVSYPTLPALAIKKQTRMELLAEEMRILYVALTRAKEKCILIGTIKQKEKLLQQWSASLEHLNWVLPDFMIAKARSYLDWLGPALIRHPEAMQLRSELELVSPPPAFLSEEPSKWSFHLITPDTLKLRDQLHTQVRSEAELAALKQTRALPAYVTSAELQMELGRRLDWNYAYPQAQQYFAKTSVSELKRNAALLKDEEETVHLFDHRDIMETAYREAAAARELTSEPDSSPPKVKKLLRRPKFMQERRISPTELGTAYHLLMQHLPFSSELSIEMINETLETLVDKQLLTEEQKINIRSEAVYPFFEQPIGKRLLQAEKVYREIPFSYGLKVSDVYPDAEPSVRDEAVLTQGVIDCVFEEAGELVLIDYKTDAIYGSRLEQVIDRYRMQLQMYAKAVEDIWGLKVKEKYLYFFDGAHLVSIEDGTNLETRFS